MKVEPKRKVKPLKEWSIYMIEAENGALYTGITKDLERRFLEHTSSDKSAKFFRSSPPKEVVFSRKGFTYSEALIEEARIKKLTKEKKLEFVKTSKLKKEKKLRTEKFSAPKMQKIMAPKLTTTKRTINLKLPIKKEKIK